MPEQCVRPPDACSFILGACALGEFRMLNLNDRRAPARDAIAVDGNLESYCAAQRRRTRRVPPPCAHGCAAEWPGAVERAILEARGHWPLHIRGPARVVVVEEIEAAQV